MCLNIHNNWELKSVFNNDKKKTFTFVLYENNNEQDEG